MLFHSRRYLPPNCMAWPPLCQVTLSASMQPVGAASLRLSEADRSQSWSSIGQRLGRHGLGNRTLLRDAVKAATWPDLLYARCAPTISSWISVGDSGCVCVMETLLP